MKKGSIKNTRINAEVRKEIQSILMNGLKDPRVSPMTTVTDARVTADLRYCTVYVSVYGGPEAEEQTLEGLRKASGYIRSELARTGEPPDHTGAQVRRRPLHSLRRAYRQRAG